MPSGIQSPPGESLPIQFVTAKAFAVGPEVSHTDVLEVECSSRGVGGEVRSDIRNVTLTTGIESKREASEVGNKRA